MTMSLSREIAGLRRLSAASHPTGATRHLMPVILQVAAGYAGGRGRQAEAR